MYGNVLSEELIFSNITNTSITLCKDKKTGIGRFASALDPATISPAKNKKCGTREVNPGLSREVIDKLHLPEKVANFNRSPPTKTCHPWNIVG